VLEPGIAGRTAAARHKLLLVDPAVTAPLLRFGFETKEKLIEWVKANVTTPRFPAWRT
jgi:hypothetical protein